MKLSIIVRTFNCASSIGDCLHAIRSSVFRDYELIVIDDASTDCSVEIARPLADVLISFPAHQGREAALIEGFKAASGEIVVNIDSDVLIPSEGLSLVSDYFLRHPNVGAITGRLSVQHPAPGFFSQYKNLYMNFIFGQLPEQVHFLYGSVFAVRRCALGVLKDYRDSTIYCDDGNLGTQLSLQGVSIHCLKNLQVIHLKTYDWCGFLANDFRVPCSFARVLWSCGGWQILGRRKGRFMHSPPWLLLSIVLTTVLTLSAPIIEILNPHWAPLLAGPLLAWILLNAAFLRFLFEQRGFSFLFCAIPVTFVDHLIMAGGIAWGTFLSLQALLHQCAARFLVLFKPEESTIPQ